MAIQSRNEEIYGQTLTKVWSDKYLKIQDSRDMNIYSVVYVTPSNISNYFSETTLSIDQIYTGISASQVIGLDVFINKQISGDYELTANLSTDVLSILDYASDGEYDDTIVINGGGADK